MTDTDLTAEVAASQDGWRAGRRYLNEHRYDLSRWAARELYGGDLQVGDSGLLTRPEWVPATPIPLENVKLEWVDNTPAPPLDGTEPESAGVRPLGRGGQRYPTYAEALGDLARPRLYEDRPCYRLLAADLHDGWPTLSFGLGTYFDVMNVCEAAAHELADARRRTVDGDPTWADLPFRSLLGDPCDPGRRPMLPAISVLTVRRSESGAAVVLHARDSAKVAHGGGMHQVMPVGMFQPSAAGGWNVGNDFDLWRCIVREYSEEFLGADEHQGVDHPLEYDRWPFYRSLTDARRAGAVSAHVLGLGVDPHSLVTDMLVTVVIDADVFDELFKDGVTTNAEGDVVGQTSSDSRIALVAATESLSRFRAQSAGAALLALGLRQSRRGSATS